METGLRYIKTRFSNILEVIHTSFWFIPSIMLFIAVVTAFLGIGIDKNLEVDFNSTFQFLLDVGPEGARSVLATIAGSMITVAGVTFSITIVSLSLASSQFGPRLLRNFMKDSGNQVALGTFISTFIYCLIVLRSVYVEGDQDFVPVLSVNLAMLLAVASVGMFIYFIHHISSSIQADQVISNVYQELDKQIDRLFPNEVEDRNQDQTGVDTSTKDEFTVDLSISAFKSGYLQAIDRGRLVEIAEKSGCIFHFDYRPGDFVIEGNTLLKVENIDSLTDELEKELRNAFIFGATRTPEQDAEFAVHQMVEVAIRSLSPGINDPYTAITCIDHLGAVLCKLVDRKFPPNQLKDDNGQLRVILKSISFTSVLNAAFNQIRQYGRSHVSVIIRLLNTLISIARLARTVEQIEAIQHQAEMIEIAVPSAIPEQGDREEVFSRFRKLIEVINNLEV